MSTPKKAYSYLRFSTPEQIKGDSKRRQLELAQQYANRHGLELDDELTFHDLGVSAYQGRNVVTGRLGAFLEAVRGGLVERGSYLLVESLDRISRRTTRKAFRVLEDICEEGITVVTLSDGRKYTEESLDDPTGLLMSILIFARANEESLTKARRVRAAWDAKRKRASERPLTKILPGWLEWDEGAGKIRVIKERSQVVKRVFRMALRGVGKHKIAETLNREGVPVFGRGRYWYRSYIAQLLANPAVVGTYVPHTVEHHDGKKKRVPLEPVPNYYPPVVSEEFFNRVKSLTSNDTRSPLRGRHATTGVVRNVFGGLAVCPRCGSTVTVVNKGSGPKGGRYLVCAKAKIGAGCKKYRSVRYEQVEDAFLRNADWLLGTVPAGDDGGVDEELERTEANIAGVEDEIERLADAVQMDPSTSTLPQRLRAMEDELEALQRTQRELLQRQAEVAGPLVDRKLADLRAALEAETLDRARVNALLRQLLKSIIVDYRSGQIVFQWKHGGESEVTFGWPKAEAAAENLPPDRWLAARRRFRCSPAHAQRW
jgi:DNA invertase Pin-like site-specific DNA recombinase